MLLESCLLCAILKMTQIVFGARKRQRSSSSGGLYSNIQESGFSDRNARLLPYRLWSDPLQRSQETKQMRAASKHTEFLLPHQRSSSLYIYVLYFLSYGNTGK